MFKRDRILGSLFVLSLDFYLIFLSPPLGFGFDLWECYEKAKRYDPRYQAVYYEFRVSRTYPRQALANLLPQVNLSYANFKYDFEGDQLFYPDYRSRTTSLSLAQPILNLPAYVEFKQSKKRNLLIAKKLDNAGQDLIKRLVYAYFEVLYHEETLRVAEEEKRAILEQLKMAKRLLAAGEATITDVNEAELKLSNIVLRLTERERNFFSAKNNLRRLIGDEPEKLAGLAEEIDFSGVELPNLEEWLDLAKKNNQMIHYYEIAKEIAKEEVKKQTYQNLPRVDLMAGYTKTNTNNYLRTQEVNYYTFGLQVRLNLFSGGYLMAKRLEALERLNQSNEELRATVSDVQQQLVESYFGAKTALVQINSAKTLLRTAEVVLDSTKKAYQAGVRTFVDVLNAQSEVYKAKSELIKAKHEFIKNWVTLRYLAGLLGEEEIKTINGWLVRN